MSILNVADAESSYLKGRAEFEEWRTNFEAMWNMPIALTYLGLYLKQLPPQAKMLAPTEAAIAQRTFEELTGG